MTKFKIFIKKFWLELIFFPIALAFSAWLMWHTFGYKDGSLMVSSKVWGDFASHIPMIRSFSQGDNFPPEFPLFPGEKIRYHFLFYAFVGVLERIGLPIDWALNLPSGFSFFLLLTSIYLLAKYLFKERSIAILAVIFFLFNGSLSFWEFLKKHPLDLSIIPAILEVKVFPAFFPYNRSSLIAGGFWNLNVFTNQRHLSLALALVLFSFLFVIKKAKEKTLTFRHCLIIGVLLGLLPFLNGAVFIMAVGVFGTYYLLSLRSYSTLQEYPALGGDELKQGRHPPSGIQRIPRLERSEGRGGCHFFKLSSLLLTMLVIALPQILYIRSGGTQSSIAFSPGYIIFDQLTLLFFLKFWFLNLGLGMFFIPLGFIIANREAKIVFLSFLSLFLIGNLFKFTPDLTANHKFFNLWIIVANMFIAYFLIHLCKKNIIWRFIVPFFVFFLIFSGLIDFLAIKNDFPYIIDDAPKNPDVRWIKENTLPRAVFLNSSYFYHPANLAGRKIFYGWPYYAWSAGYQTEERKMILRQIFEEKNPKRVCQLLKENKIDYVALEKKPSIEEIQVDQTFWRKNFVAVYQNEENGFIIYQVSISCP